MSQSSDIVVRVANTATARDIWGIIVSSSINLNAFIASKRDMDDVAKTYERFFLLLCDMTPRATKVTLRAGASLYDTTLTSTETDSFATLVAKVVRFFQKQNK